MPGKIPDLTPVISSPNWYSDLHYLLFHSWIVFCPSHINHTALVVKIFEYPKTKLRVLEIPWKFLSFVVGVILGKINDSGNPLLVKICIILCLFCFSFYLSSHYFWYICASFYRTDLLSWLRNFWMKSFVLGIRVLLRKNWRVLLIKFWFYSGLFRLVWLLD